MDDWQKRSNKALDIAEPNFLMLEFGMIRDKKESSRGPVCYFCDLLAQRRGH